jgi:hypothetical protein
LLPPRRVLVLHRRRPYRASPPAPSRSRASPGDALPPPSLVLTDSPVRTRRHRHGRDWGRRARRRHTPGGVRRRRRELVDGGTAHGGEGEAIASEPRTPHRDQRAQPAAPRSSSGRRAPTCDSASPDHRSRFAAFRPPTPVVTRECVPPSTVPLACKVV